jgi:hypothetical protein
MITKNKTEKIKIYIYKNQDIRSHSTNYLPSHI